MASEPESKPLSALQREAEMSRANLMHTVDSLQSRVSPHAIKDDIKEYVRDTGNTLLYNVERRIRENPLQAVAIATGLAFPLWRLLTSIPAPIVLIGAGIALTQGGSGAPTSIGARPRGSSFAGTMGQSTQTVSERISHTADTLTHQVGDAADAAKEKIQTLGTQAADAVGDAIHAAQDLATDSAAATSDAVSQAYRTGVDIADQTAQEVGQALNRTKDTLTETIERHPLIVGGVGLLIGAFIASCIPATAAENSAFGQISDSLKDRARDVVSEGAGVVKAAADEMYDQAVSQARQDGLTSDVVRDTVRDAGEKVKGLAQKAADQLDQLGPESGAPGRILNQTGERR